MREALEGCHKLLILVRAFGPKTIDVAEVDRLIAEVDGAFQFDAIVGEIERGFAYERAIDLIETHCPEMDTEELILTYYDLENSDDEGSSSEAAMYLDSRRLLQRHPDHHMWVAVLDEGEPLPSTEGSAA